jgi:mRNA interferase MazF
MAFNRGDVVLIPIPYTDLSATKTRPAVIVSSSSYLPKPSFVRPKVAAIEPTLVVHQAGQLVAQDLLEVDRRLRQAMSLTDTALADVIAEVDLGTQSPELVQSMAEKSLKAVVVFGTRQTPGINIERLKEMLRE